MCNEDNINRLLNIYKKFTEDNQKFVKNSAIEVIGYFTNVLPRNYKSARFIIEFYLKTLDILYLNKDVASLADNEIFYQCAFNFPAILFYFGKESWPELSQYYCKMTADKFYKVRKSLASSINEISTIIGKEETEKTLIPIFDRFYREEGEIQRAIYKSMPKFLLNINYEKRISYLERIKRLMNGREKWRVKKECVEILGNLGGVYEFDIAYEIIFPICIKLCVDEVSEVRVHSAKSIKSLVIQFLSNKQYSERISNILKAFSMSIKYIYRNLYIHLAEELVDNKEIFEKYFIENIELLSRDKVPNIQVHMAKLLTKMYHSKNFNDNPIFRKMYLRLSLNNKLNVVKENLCKVDEEHESFFSFKNDEEKNQILSEEYSNYMFNNRMEILRELNVMIGPGLLNSVNKFARKDKDSELSTNGNNKNIEENEDDQQSDSSNSFDEKDKKIKENDKPEELLNNNDEQQIDYINKLNELNEVNKEKLENININTILKDCNDEKTDNVKDDEQSLIENTQEKVNEDTQSD